MVGQGLVFHSRVSPNLIKDKLVHGVQEAQCGVGRTKCNVPMQKMYQITKYS